ncbi:MAG: DNA replication and repair protein RecF [Spirochaetales bacterium]
MGFSALRFYHFRNLEDQTLTWDSKEIFLVGENGQGKTNVLEALYCMSYGKSFRGKKDTDLIRRGESEALVEGSYTSEEQEGFSLRFYIGENKGETQKKITLEGKELKDRLELVGSIPTILFVPEDIQYIIGSPEAQRTFFNQTCILSKPSFLRVWKGYVSLLKHRNAVLKKGNRELLGVYDEELVRLGLEVQRERTQVLSAFAPVFSSVFSEVSQIVQPVALRYLPSWKEEDPKHILRTLNLRQELDLRFGITTTGPHRDRFLFLFGDGEFVTTASNGQIRLASLVLRIAQALFYTERTGRKPILLIDDVLLEMDYARRRRFFSVLPAYEQAIFTFLPDEPYKAYQQPNTRVYTVKRGRVEEHG